MSEIDGSDSEDLHKKTPLYIEAEEKIEKRRRIWLLAIALPVILAVMLKVSYSGYIFGYSGALSLTDGFISFLSLCLVSFSGLVSIMYYLQSGFRRGTESEVRSYVALNKIGADEAIFRQQQTAEIEALRLQLGVVRAEVDRVVNLASAIGNDDRAALVKDLKAQLNNEASAAFVEEIKTELERHQKINSDTKKEKVILDCFESSKIRISEELASLGRRGNLNLALGAATSVAGLILLGASVFQEVSLSGNIWSVIAHFLPRLTLVVMIELFAYFFLTLYKSSLQEIKYFQNELTNAEFKQIAFRAAFNLGDPVPITNIILSLSATERNHVLSKDQTTVELEKAKVDKDGRGDMVKYLAEILSKKS
ncbi:hypothetical protein ACMSIO_15410 [Pseudomonas benzopyrenica]|uniref:hypothetical protein n=1 Tax=Pseudomonas benzopyrenica TaxID=2993566 RepID=UPI0039C00404